MPLMIRGIINYPKLEKPKTKREKRAEARAKGRCGECITGIPERGYKTCLKCRNAKKKYEILRVRNRRAGPVAQ